MKKGPNQRAPSSRPATMQQDRSLSRSLTLGWHTSKVVLMGYYEKLTNYRATLKHAPELVGPEDLSEIRSLLGVAQEREELMIEILGGGFTMNSTDVDGFQVWDVELKFCLDQGQRNELLLVMSGED